MPDSTIANLPSGSPAQLSDVLPVQRGSSTLNLAVSDIKTVTLTNDVTINSTAKASITNIVETSGSVVTLSVVGNTATSGSVAQLTGLTVGTWLNSQTVLLIAPTNATTMTFVDPTSHGAQSSSAETGTASSGGFQAGSIYIDYQTAALYPFTNAQFPQIPAGTYVVKMAITDGTGRWSNLVSYTLTADGAHSYAIQWTPPTSWWSVGTETLFSNTFTNNANVYAWVSFNGGAFTQLVNNFGVSQTFVGYSFFLPYVRLCGSYVTGAVPIPSNLNSMPAINLTTGGPAQVITGAVLQAPTIGWINISQEGNFGSPGGQGLTICDPTTNDTVFISPFSQGGYLLFEQGGIGTGELTFNAGAVTGNVLLSCGNNGSNFTGTLAFNLGIQGANAVLDFTQVVGGKTFTLPNSGGALEVITGATLQKSESAADGTVLSFTPPTVAGQYRINFSMSVSAQSAATLGWTASWKDSNHVAQTPTNLSLSSSGTAAPALTFVVATNGVYYGSAVVDVDNSGTAIVIKLTFSGTSFTAKTSASIERLQ